MPKQSREFAENLHSAQAYSGNLRDNAKQTDAAAQERLINLNMDPLRRGGHLLRS